MHYNALVSFSQKLQNMFGCQIERVLIIMCLDENMEIWWSWEIFVGAEWFLTIYYGFSLNNIKIQNLKLCFDVVKLCWLKDFDLKKILINY